MKRKVDHIEMAKSSQVKSLPDGRFYYEPLFSAHPKENDNSTSLNWLGHSFDFPLWISSMTGGVGEAKILNIRLAKAANKFGLGMGLGSCRKLIESRSVDSSFMVRKYIGDRPLFSNIGIAQVEQLALENKVGSLKEVIKRTETDGIIVHINTIQEWYQPEGDRLKKAPIETLKVIRDELKDTKILVKEVGQGMGPRSLAALTEISVDGIEFAAYGGTHFGILENDRSESKKRDDLLFLGHTAKEMLEFFDDQALKDFSCEFIFSGGIRTPRDAYWLLSQSKKPSLCGIGFPLIEEAKKSEEHLENFLSDWIRTFKMLKTVAMVKG